MEEEKKQGDNAFTLLAGKTSKAHNITPGVVFDKEKVTLTFPIGSIAQSKRSDGAKGSVGFMCQPAEFVLAGKRYALRPGWVTLSALGDA
jgi:hypothetical protein